MNTGFDFLPSVLDDTFPVYSGLFNEVISSSMARYQPPIAAAEEQEENNEQEEEKKDGDFIVL